MTDKVIVALPAYNEERYIAGIVGKATQYTDIVFVLDDGSTDDTAWEAMGAGAEVIQHLENKGYGATIQDILSAVRGTDFGVLVIMDADNQHDVADIPKLLQAIQDEADLVIGCRVGKDVPFFRRIGGTILSVFTWMLSGVWVRDSQCGFRAYSKRAVELIRPRENGMAVSSEIVALASWNGLKIVEVPIAIRYSADSSTHNPWKQGFYTLWRIVVMMMKRRLGR
jgi:glycosyltransferase involved in cell wall biosynthesis